MNKKTFGIIKAAWILSPLLFAALYVSALLYTDEIYWGSFPVLRPLELPSLIGAIVLAGMIAFWGFAGAWFAAHRTPFFRSLLLSHIIPMAAVLAYSVFHIVAAFQTDGTSLSDMGNIIGTLGMGLFNIAGSYIFLLIPLKIYEVYLDFIIMLGVFAIGYSICISKLTNKKKRGF